MVNSVSFATERMYFFWYKARLIGLQGEGTV